MTTTPTDLLALARQTEEFNSLYVVTGNVKDMNTMLVPLSWLRALQAAQPDREEKLLFELEGIVAFSDGFGLYGDGPAAKELRKWIAGARAAIASMKGTPE